MNVLIVDDDPDIQCAVEIILREAGLTVVGVAQDGTEAIELASRLLPEAILMDMRMPNLNGIDATRAIAAILPNTRIVMFSAYGDPALRESAIDAGATGFLVKGCAAADIIEALGS